MGQVTQKSNDESTSGMQGGRYLDEADQLSHEPIDAARKRNGPAAVA
jgi:hypothetical protein